MDKFALSSIEAVAKYQEHIKEISRCKFGVPIEAGRIFIHCTAVITEMRLFLGGLSPREAMGMKC